MCTAPSSCQHTRPPGHAASIASTSPSTTLHPTSAPSSPRHSATRAKSCPKCASVRRQLRAQSWRPTSTVRSGVNHDGKRTTTAGCRHLSLITLDSKMLRYRCHAHPRPIPGVKASKSALRALGILLRKLTSKGRRWARPSTPRCVVKMGVFKCWELLHRPSKWGCNVCGQIRYCCSVELPLKVREPPSPENRWCCCESDRSSKMTYVWPPFDRKAKVTLAHITTSARRSMWSALQFLPWVTRHTPTALNVGQEQQDTHNEVPDRIAQTDNQRNAER